jgi:hypothetical protein
MIREIALSFRNVYPDVAITVIGATLDDLQLMRIGNIFVTGKVDAAELEPLLEAYRLGRLFLGSARPLFGHPLLAQAVSSSLPVAYLDWSVGGVAPRDRDLPIDPSASLRHVTGELARWMAGP